MFQSSAARRRSGRSLPGENRCPQAVPARSHPSTAPAIPIKWKRRVSLIVGRGPSNRNLYCGGKGDGMTRRGYGAEPMRSRLLNDLAVLASERFQERYIVNGTKEQYALPDEILDAALSNAAQASTASILSPTEAIAAREFVVCAGEASSCIDFQDTTVSSRQLMEQDEHWSAVRLAARRLLGAFHFDLDEWERQQGLR